MKKLSRIFLKSVALFVGLFFVYSAFALIHAAITDYKPEDVVPLQAEQDSVEETISDSILSFTIWNLGYGGLGAESEFFYDSGSRLLSWGKMIRAPKELVERNIDASAEFVTQVKSDFFLFQEVDYHSKRSYYINQFELIGKNLPGFSAFFAPNFDVRRVPIPLLEPWRVYGRAYSGLGTFSRFQPVESLRYQLPGRYPWPDHLFSLDRCASLHRFRLTSGKELVVVNIHNSAYDEDGDIKRRQMEFLKELFLEEYDKGNYVIAGGDWNECPPWFEFDTFMPGRTQGYFQYNIAADFLPPDWRWVYDPDIPTNRKTRAPYVPGETFITVIDFFLISPNVQVISVKCLDQQFQFSDHQPVWMEVRLR
jgi:endonuclease/exonuclease/phosphatase family metal-dependent hydrolase